MIDFIETEKYVQKYKTQQISTLKYNKWKIHKNINEMLYIFNISIRYLLFVVFTLLVMSNKPIYEPSERGFVENLIFQGLQIPQVFLYLKKKAITNEGLQHVNDGKCH